MKKMIILFLACSMLACANATNEEIEATADSQIIVETENETEEMNMHIHVNDHDLLVEMEDNSSSQALLEMLSENDLVVEMDDYANFEKVGSIGTTLPRNDTQITTVPGDVILYQGNSITIYYDTNSWNFTKLGHITNVSDTELREILGEGSITATFSLE